MGFRWSKVGPSMPSSKNCNSKLRYTGILGAGPKSPHAVESRIAAALLNGDARFGESHITSQNVTVNSPQEKKHAIP